MSSTIRSIGQNLEGFECPQEEGQGSFLRRFKFLTNLKRFFLSKFSLTRKYENTTVSSDISIISYKEYSFDSPNSQVQPYLGTDQRALTALEEVLRQRERIEQENFVKGKLELLQTIEKTFAKQLDVFEQLLFLIRSNNIAQQQKEMENKQLSESPSEAERSINEFLKDLIKNIALQLSNVADNIPKQLNLSVSGDTLNGETSRSRTENNSPEFGDTFNIGDPDVDCECGHLTESGAAVPCLTSISECTAVSIDEKDL